MKGRRNGRKEAWHFERDLGVNEGSLVDNESWTRGFARSIQGSAQTWRGILQRAAALLAFLLIICPNTAYAAGSYQRGLAGVIQGPTVWYDYGDSPDDGYYGYFVYAYNVYDAAMYALDKDPDDESITADMKAKLSNASTGGSFYTFAQEFHTFGASSEPKGWLSKDFYGQWVTLYGRDFLYWGEVTQEQIDAAKRDLKIILDGGSLGGGTGSGIESGDYVLLQSSKPTSERAYIAGLNESGNYKLMMNVAPKTCKLTIKGGLQEAIEEKYNDGYDLFIVMNGHWSNVTTKNTVSIYMLQPNTYTLQNVTYDGVTFPNLVSNTSIEYYSRSRSYTRGTYENGALDIEMSLTGSYASLTKQTNSINLLAGGGVSSSGTNNYGGYYLLLKADGTSSNPQNPTIPPTQWPETPQNPTPTQPTVPTPEPPTTPTQPEPPLNPPNITYPTIVYESDTTYVTADLSAVLDALNEHCEHLQTSIGRGFTDYWNTLQAKWNTDFASLKTFLHGQYGYIGNTITTEMAATRQYLKQLFEWLANQFDFSVSGGGYDDDTVVSWLKKIYGKLGSGYNTRPVDPVAQPNDFWTWLDNLFKNFVIDLVALGHDGLAEVMDALRTLVTKFPFSIPWDIAAMLGMLVAEPITPTIDIPQYALQAGGLAEVGTYRISLDAYDAAFEGVRFMEKLAFCVLLAWRTPEFRKMLSRGD